MRKEIYMANFDLLRARSDFQYNCTMLRNQGIVLDEKGEALLFAKLLQLQISPDPANTTFCSDAEFYVNLTPTGYAVAGYYTLNGQNPSQRHPFQITVSKNNGFWGLASAYVAPDTKTGSNFLLTWVLLMLGCTFFGILMYFIISAAVGL